MLPVPEAGAVKGGANPPAVPGPESEDIFLRLKTLWRRIADTQGVPPYVIFPDCALREMAVSKPMDMAAFGRLFGVGDFKREKYGPAFIDEIAGSVAS